MKTGNDNAKDEKVKDDKVEDGKVEDDKVKDVKVEDVEDGKVEDNIAEGKKGISELKKEITEGKKRRFFNDLKSYFDKYAKHEPVVYISSNSLSIEAQPKITTQKHQGKTLAGNLKSKIDLDPPQQDKKGKIKHAPTLRRKDKKVSAEKSISDVEIDEADNDEEGGREEY